MGLENVSDEPTQECPINGRNVGIAGYDTSPCLAADKTIEKESENSSHYHADNYVDHSFFSHRQIDQSPPSKVN